MSKGRRTVALALLVAGLVLAALGQYYFFYRRDVPWDGAVLYGLALVCFLLAWRQSQPPAARRDRPKRPGLGAWTQEHPIPAAFLALAALCSSATVVLLKDRLWNQPTGDAVLLWAFGIACVATAALWPETGWRRPWRRWVARLRAIRRPVWIEAGAVLALTLLAFVLRVADLGRVPYTVGGDEAWHGLLARQVLSGQLSNPFVMGYMSMPTFFYWPVSWSLWLVGDTVTGLRMPAALAGTLTVPLLYLLARDLWGRRTALISAAFLAAYDYHIHYSRLGANNVWDPLFVVAVFWLLERGLSRARGGQDEQDQSGARPASARYYLLAGLIAGLAAHFYTGARLLPLLVAGYLSFIGVQRCLGHGQPGGEAGLSWRDVALLVLAFLLVAAPMLSYALSHPDEWNARINQVGIFQSGWLAREPELTGKSTLQILAEQFLRAAGAFHLYPDRTAWYGAERPLLGFLPGVFAVLGMAWAIAHWRERRYFLVLFWFWATIITGGMLTESPPSSQRLVIAIPAVALLVAFGVKQTVRLLWRTAGFRPRWKDATIALLVLLMAASSLHYYFVTFTPALRYGSANGEAATMIGYYLRDQGAAAADAQVYFFAAPQIYWSFGTMPFLAPNIAAQDVVEPLQAPPDFVDRGRDALFILMPWRAGELDWIRQAFPAGQVQEFRDARGDLRFIVYRVEKESGGG